MKRIITILLIFAMMFAMFACGKQPVEDLPTIDDFKTEDNDPEYIAEDDDNYVTEDEKLSEAEANEVDEDYSYIPYEQEETASSDQERIMMEGYQPEDILALPLPKSYNCETLNLETVEMTSAKSKTYKSGDRIVPELKNVDFQYVLDSKMTADSMNYVLTMAAVNDQIIRFQYTINMATKKVMEVQVNTDTYSKVYTFKY